MSALDKRLEEYKEELQKMELSEEKILMTIQKSEEAFYRSEQERPVSWYEFLFIQASYIQKRWWIFQGMLLAVLWLFLSCLSTGIYMQRVMGVTAPMFVIMLLPELWKNRSSFSVEIEGAAYYSLRQIYAARMLLFVMVDVLLLSIFFAAASFTVKMTIAEAVVQFFLPFNVTCCICLRTFCSRKISSEYAAMAVCMVWAAFWCIVVLKESVYETVSLPVWAAAVAASLFYMCFCVHKILKDCTCNTEDYLVQGM